MSDTGDRSVGVRADEWAAASPGFASVLVFFDSVALALTVASGMLRFTPFASLAVAVNAYFTCVCGKSCGVSGSGVGGRQPLLELVGPRLMLRLMFL